MALIDRLAHDIGTETIANHAFSAAMWFWSRGDVTRAQVIAAFALDATDEVQLDQLSTHYQALTVDRKQEFHSDMEAAGVLLESGLITKAKYKSLLGLT